MTDFVLRGGTLVFPDRAPAPPRRPALLCNRPPACMYFPA